VRANGVALLFTRSASSSKSTTREHAGWLVTLMQNLLPVSSSIMACLVEKG
jgi:hypothetical protein